MATIKQVAILEDFSCLGADCEDTCCKGWGMQLDSFHHELYAKKQPALLEAVVKDGENFLMRRDSATDYCVKFDQGLCAIHKEQGASFLGDACHFYPRVSKRLGETVVMSATLSCPEYTRLALFGPRTFSFSSIDIERIQLNIKDYLIEGVSSEEGLALHESFIRIPSSNPDERPERVMARILTMTRSLSNLPPSQWSQAFDLLSNISSQLLPAPEPHPMDHYRLVLTLIALISAAPKSARPRLSEVIEKIKYTLNINIKEETFEVMLRNNSGPAFTEIEAKWESETIARQPLKRWIQSQLSMSLYPFGGLGNSLAEKAMILGVRFATVRLALMCFAMEKPLDKETIVFVIQSLSRFLDHLSDPALSIAAYTEAGWASEPRMRALIGDK